MNNKDKKTKLSDIFTTVQLNIKSLFNSVSLNDSQIKDVLEKKYISEENYIKDMKNIVEPYINNRLKSGYIDGSEDVKLYYEQYKIRNTKANIVICHGFSESLEKYHEMIYYFMKSGYNVFCIEHRGHGRSGTLGIVDKTQINVNNFNEYVLDFKAFMDKVVIPNSKNKKVFLFAHSMGGAIGTKFMEDYPDYFAAAVLNAPMFEVHTGNVPSSVASIIAKKTVSIGKGGDYVLGKSPYKHKYGCSTSTSCINRYNYVNDIVFNHEEFQRGGPSYNWLSEAFKVTSEILREENTSKIKIPVLLFQAGEDTYVKPNGQNKFAERVKNCKIRQFENAKHSIYMERDEIQKVYLKEVLDFYNRPIEKQNQDIC